MSEFKEHFPKTHRPMMDELSSFLNPDVYELYQNFAATLMEQYDLRFGIPSWTEKNGWVYRIGKSGESLFTGMVMEQDRFILDQITVSDQESYHKMLEHISMVYEEEKAEFLSQIAAKNKKQAERSRRRIEREKEEKELLQEKINEERYNKFHWPEKLNLVKLRKLYKQNAQGIQEEELADEIGMTLYLRCKYGKEDMELMNEYKIRCHHCGRIIEGRCDFRECECGEQYSYKEYRRSYRRNNMPSGAAEKVFNEYIKQWPKAKDYSSKMILIDRLLHEFHLSLISGAVHRPVAMNFMDGSRERVEQIILELAYQ